MVFALRHVEYGETLILGLNRTYTLGRSRRNDIHLLDITVNNRHAKLEIKEDCADIEDRNSDFGTWVNKRRISEPFRLQHGDVIVFGKANCKYVFLDSKFEALIDQNVSKPTQCLLEQTLKELNVALNKDYKRGSTHYIAESVSLDTLKKKTILYSLIDRKTVITPKYFVNILANIKEAPLMPNIYRYMPEVDNHLKSKGIEDINPRKKRRHIFENAIFIFFDKECDQELSDLVLKCGGDAVQYSQKENFFEDLFKDFNKYEYIAVNHSSNEKRPLQMVSFLRSMKQKRKKVSSMSVDDLYISILKGDLVGVESDVSHNKTNNDKGIQEPQPGTSKSSDIVILESSDDEISGGKLDVIDIVRQVVHKKPQTINTFSKLAAAYKAQKTIRETVQESHMSSPTLNRWVTRKRAANGVQKTSANGVATCSTPTRPNGTNEDKYKINNLNESDECDSKQSTDCETLDKHEKNNDNINTAAIAVATGPGETYLKVNARMKRKKRNGKLQREPEERVDDCQEDDSDGTANEKDACTEEGTGRLHSKKNEKRKSIVLNPFAALNNSKRTEAKQNSSSNLEDWLKKYKNVEIIPMS